MAKEIVPLTSVRGIAAVAVILLHFSTTIRPLAAGDFPSLAPHGELAVDMFFMLSGFIMAYTYLESFSCASNWHAYSRFLWTRIARVIPLNIAVVTFFSVFGVTTDWLFNATIFPRIGDLDLGTYIANIFLLPGIGIGRSINWPAWSISVEFAAYVLFPVLLAGIFRPIWPFMILAATAMLAVVCITGQHLSPDGIHSNKFLPWRDLGRCISEFVLGLGTYRIYNSGYCAQFLKKDRILLGLMLATSLVIVFRIGDLFAVLLFPIMLLCFVSNRGYAAQLLSTKFFHFLGIISYSLYLVHDNFRSIIAQILNNLHPTPFHPIVAMVWVIMCSSLMILPAWACYKWIEKPSREYFKRLIAGLEKEQKEIQKSAPKVLTKCLIFRSQK